MEGMKYLLISITAMQSTAGKPIDFLGNKRNELYKSKLSTSPGQKKLVVESERSLRKSLLNWAVQSEWHHACANGMTISASADETLMDALKAKENLKFSSLWEVMQIRLGWLAVGTNVQWIIFCGGRSAKEE